MDLGDMDHVRVAGPAYQGHCIQWDFPLLNITGQKTHGMCYNEP